MITRREARTNKQIRTNRWKKRRGRKNKFQKNMYILISQKKEEREDQYPGNLREIIYEIRRR